jgi:hypothetical protein
MTSEITTVTVQIGNSDDKLTQAEWSNYVDNVHNKIREYAKQMHFFGGSPNWYAWQNACFVFEIDEKFYTELCSELKFIREFFEQGSIAIVRGNTEFI